MNNFVTTFSRNKQTQKYYLVESILATNTYEFAPTLATNTKESAPILDKNRINRYQNMKKSNKSTKNTFFLFIVRYSI